MKKVSFALVGAVSLALAACGHKEEEVVGNNDVVAEEVDAVVENTANGGEAVVVDDTAAVATPNGVVTEETVDEADLNAAQVNAM